MGYEDTYSHYLMIEDGIRTGAYLEAIEQVVRPSSRVLDFGCGTGILSFFAAKQGARSVFAVDRSRFIRVARELARANGLGGVEFFHGEGKDIELPGKVDVLISEWMGHFVFYEQMLGPLVALRDRYLEPGGVMVPERIILKVGLVTDEQVCRELTYFRKRRYGIDFSFIEDWPYYQVTPRTFGEDQLSGDVITLGSIDMAACGSAPTPLRGEGEVHGPATVYGLCGWFDAELTRDVVLRTGPFDHATHWRHLFFPLPDPIDLRAGDRLDIEIVPVVDPSGERTLWKWSVEHPKGRVEMDDFVHKGWLMRDLPPGKLD